MKKIVIILIFSFVLVGFTDCHFDTYQVVYNTSSCPENLQLPSSVHTDEFDIKERFQRKDANNTFICKKLKSYNVTKYSTDRNIEGTYNINSILIKDTKCKLLLSYEFVGPSTTSQNTKEVKQNLENVSNKIAIALLRDAYIKPEFPPALIEYIGSKEEYIKWCNDLAGH